VIAVKVATAYVFYERVNLTSVALDGLQPAGNVAVGTLPSPAPAGYGGPSVALASGTVQASPAPTTASCRISGVALPSSGTAPSTEWVGLQAYRPATGGRRTIATMALASGTGTSALYDLTFPAFGSAPAAGETIDVG
jgi:hypothetical protein